MDENLKFDMSVFSNEDMEENKLPEVDAEDTEGKNKDGNDLGGGTEIDSNLPNKDKNENDDNFVDPNDDGTPKEGEEGYKPTNEGSENDNNIKLVYNNVAGLLKEEGLFTDEELDLEKIDSPDMLAEAIKSEIKRNEFADLSATQKEYLEAIRDGVPEDVFLQHKQVQQTYNSITDTMVAENEQLRKDIIVADLSAKGIGESRIEMLYKTMVDAGEDLGEAMTSLNGMKAAEATRYEAETAEIARKKEVVANEEKARMKSVKDNVYDTKEIIKNYKITEALKDKVYQTMTKSVGYNQDGQPINELTSERDKNPVEFDTKLYYLFTMTKGFNDFSIFEKKAQSKAAEKLERIVRDTTLKTGSNPIVTDHDSQDIPQIVKLHND